MTPERAPSEPGHGISWLNSTSASVKSLWLNSKCGSTRSVTPIVSMGSGSEPDRKSTRLNSSHSQISYAVFCLKKKNHLQRHLPSTQRRSTHQADEYTR